jgi:hypothetical protein
VTCVLCLLHSFAASLTIAPSLLLAVPQVKNFINAASFARRLLELCASSGNAALMTKVCSVALRVLHAFMSVLVYHCAFAPSGDVVHPNTVSRGCVACLQAQKVLQISEGEARNAHRIEYDEKNPFVICCGSLTPIYKGSPTIRSSYCNAPYRPEFRGTVCVIDGMSVVGQESIGLVCQAAPSARR